ncbi:uncharacterized protein DNG_09897 [Cephalotrichum gorgonifer]|uniref:Major facilitator superfamily (MFS) profile domain-containing protein n=1 Tax=Cephalotrichum gorgonifer TaxID=2041049 RepID=A0AAE8N889_9PEZI|nr:uncharacterized protein DNG_09897 [Cephalotrichum gorgonifer]
MSTLTEKSSASMAHETGNVSPAQESPPGPVSMNYEPVTPEDRCLDRWTNLKFDAFDKSNVGYVATSTFIEDAHLTPDAVSLALTLFSATYVPLHPVSTIASFLVGSRYWISALLFCCGVLCMSHAAVDGDKSLAALRLLLGCAEAGYNPCCVFLFSLYYPRYSLAIRMGVFTAMFAVSGAVAGLIAYGLLSVRTATIHGWQIVFLFEGGLTILMAVAVFILVPNKIETARFLSPKEHQHAVHRMEIDTQGRPTGSGRISWRDITDVLKDWKKLLIILFGICAITSMNAFPAFLPLLVQGMGYHGHLATLMSVPPFVAGIVGLMIAMWSSDRFKDRSSHLVGGLAIGLVGTVIMACAENNAVRYMAAHICLPGVLTGASLISVWLANNTDEGVCPTIRPFPRLRSYFQVDLADELES